MIPFKIYRIFKKGSRTYFTSSLFFPKDVKSDIFTLYSFVRTFDNFVDTIPQDRGGFFKFKKEYEKTLSGKSGSDLVLNGFCELIKRKNIKKEWVSSFIKSMREDLSKKKRLNLAETKRYMTGSAEVIGLFMARILGLPERSFACARLLGRAMQYINFIRDIDEDRKLGRTYLPFSEMAKYGLKNLDYNCIKNEPGNFSKFIRAQIAIYRKWQSEAEKGFANIPRRYKIPVKTASDMYMWTAGKIAKDPMIVFRKKVKPGFFRILLKAAGNFFG